MSARTGPDLTSMSALISSAIHEWDCNRPDEAGRFEEPSIVAWEFVRASDPKIDPDNEGLQDTYAFHAGFDMALELAVRLFRQPFADVSDIIERTSEQCVYDLKVSVENRAGRRRKRAAGDDGGAS